MRVAYTPTKWDITDKQEVDLINLAIEVSDTPIHALDSIYDAGAKLLRAIEHSDTIYSIQEIKLQSIVKGFRDLANRVEGLEVHR